MLLIQKRCEATERFDEKLQLPFELRSKSRLRTQLPSGEDIGIFLERGTVLKSGDCLEADDGRVVRIEAAPERLMQAASGDPLLLNRAAYHLGNRHVPLEIEAGMLRFCADAVLK